jgi:hypothetical protein
MACNHRQYHLAEVDWIVPLTLEDARKMNEESEMLSDSFNCAGSQFRLALMPNSAVHKGMALRLISNGPVHRFHIRSVVAEVYVQEKVDSEITRSKGRRWSPGAFSDGRVDVREARVGWFPFVTFTEFVSKEKTHFISHNNVFRLHVELFLHADGDAGRPVGNALGAELLAYRSHDMTFDARFILRDGTELGFHKAIVCARSPYMHNQIYHDQFSANTTGRHDACEFDPAAFFLFLKLVYTDDSEHLVGATVEVMLEVLRIGDMYGVASVVAACDISLVNGEMLTVDTCGMLLAIGHKFHRSALRKAAMDFFKRNAKRVMGTEGLRKCIMDNPVLALEVMQYSL